MAALRHVASARRFEAKRGNDVLLFAIWQDGTMAFHYADRVEYVDADGSIKTVAYRRVTCDNLPSSVALAERAARRLSARIKTVRQRFEVSDGR